jgi:hypothetical protein
LSDSTRGAIRELAIIYLVECAAISNGNGSEVEVSVMSLMSNELLVMLFDAMAAIEVHG